MFIPYTRLCLLTQCFRRTGGDIHNVTITNVLYASRCHSELRELVEIYISFLKKFNIIERYSNSFVSKGLFTIRTIP